MMADREQGRSSRIGVIGMLAVAPVVAGAVVVMVMKVAMNFGAGFVTSIRLAILGTVSLFVGSLGTKNLQRFVPRLPRASESAVLLAIGTLLGIFWFRIASQSFTVPHLFGVDPAHHGALVSWLVEEGRLPVADSRLVGLTNYPIGAHLLTAVVANMGRLTPLAAMAVVTLGIIASQVLAIAWLARLTSPRRSWLGAPPALAIWILGWHYGFGSVTESFFFSQALAVSFCLVGLGLLAHGAAGMPPRQWMPALVVLIISTGLTYPQHAPILPVCFAFVLAKNYLRPIIHRLRQNWIRVAVVSIPGLGVLGFLVWREVQTSPFLTKQAFFGIGEGSLTQPSFAVFGGTLVVVLLVAGALEVFVGARHRPEPLVLAIGLGAVGGITALLGLGRTLGWSVTRYRVIKNLFLAFPLLSVAVGVAVAVGVQTLMTVMNPVPMNRRQLWHRWETISALLGIGFLLAVALRPSPLRLTSEPLVDQDAYELSLKAVRRIPADQIGLAGRGVSPYVISWMGLRRAAKTGNEILAPRMRVWEAWPEGPTTEKYLLVDGSVRSMFSSRAGVKVVARHGTAALLQRTR